MIDKKIKDVLANINKKYAKQISDDTPAIFIAGEYPELTKPSFLSTGIIEVDAALGGIPKGSVTNIHGGPWSGKTSFCLGVAAGLTKQKKYVVYVNLEGIALSVYQEFIDFDPNYIVEIQPKLTAEQTISDIEDLIYDKDTKKPTGLFDLVIIDSLNNLHTDAKEKAWLESPDKEPRMGSRAKLIDDFLTRIYGKAMLRGGTTIMTITQDRANINPMGMHAPKTVMSCGESIKFNAKVTLKISRKINSTKTGQTVMIEVEKNSMTGTLAKAEFGIIYKKGIDDSQTLFDKALDYGYLQAGSKRGSYLLIVPGLGDVEIAGKKEVTSFIASNPEVAQALRTILTGKKPAEVNRLGYDYLVKEESIEEE